MTRSRILSLSAVAAAFALAVAVGGLSGNVPSSVASTPAGAAPSAGETSSRVIEDGGTGQFKAVAVGDSALPTHTIFRPKDLSPFGAGKKLPIMTWGNGACANTPAEHQNFLSEIASHGYLVIAIGPAGQAGRGGAGAGPGRGAGMAPARGTGTAPGRGPSTAPGRGAGGAPGRGAGVGGSGGADSQLLLKAVDWAIAQNSKSDSPYFGKLDTANIAAAGMSCGGLQALEVSPDPRIKTPLVCNSGIFIPAAEGGGTPVGGMPSLPKDHLTKLHAPIIYILGGTTDIAYTNGMDDFKRIEKLPAVAANMEGIGHGGTYGRPHGGEFTTVALAWLDWNLKGDTEAAKMFQGDTPGLAKNPAWKIEKKNIP
jgi:hypothetical protein